MNLRRSINPAARAFVVFVPCVLFTLAAPAQQPPSLALTQDGHLTYTADERGNRIPDFSHCGYSAGEKPIPTAPVRVVVAPEPGDNTAHIQRGIDHVASLPPDANGLRGAVLLLKGRYEVLGGLQITNSGVVLRGQGVGEAGTILVAAGLDRRTLIRVAGNSDLVTSTNSNWRIVDDYLPVGAKSLHLQDATGINPGDPIRLIRPSTSHWIEQLGATDFGGGLGGGWKPGSRDITWHRVVRSIAGNLLTLDAPITTALEQPAPIRPIRPMGRITQVGIENLTLESAFDSTNPKDENHSWCAITMEHAADAWVRQITFKHFAGSAVALYETCQRVTVQDCLARAPVSEIGGYRRLTFFTMGQQTLFLRCHAEHGRHDFAVGHCAAGPNAFVQCEAHQALDDSGPIESWASGVLYDNVTIEGNALTLGFRPGNNAGIGWAAANCVLWNCSASVIRCWNPPGAHNWSFGSWGSFEGDGVWRRSNDFMTPGSLFAAQVKDRLGPAAAARLQLMPRPQEESSNPPLDKAQELAAASHQPSPQLRDYIAAAGKRDPILCEPGSAMRVEGIPMTRPASRIRRHALLITNGWLTGNGKLLIGGSANVAWWRGSIRPTEAASFGLGVTRFVPGRIGPGFTDDLNQVVASLSANGQAALDHNYGLWYDRRRDDHERVRRISGDVLPPFFEQPFARVGLVEQRVPPVQSSAQENRQDALFHYTGTAWDGLSKYDLTKFNPWYWSRLKEFSDLADERGLVLFHQNYFQHNILEAGAHWADCPWRSANNLNETGFPEPPPYAGDKRIFQAELFYDVTHPTRRKLHEGYIRQCLDNFTNNANVIQFTSAEFTGPKEFVEFWLDTIAAWERDQPLPQPSATLSPSGGERDGLRGRRQPMVALSCTKDVQDAILSDAKRNALVDVIDFRYWWRTEKGEFAPPGGRNLAPRQFERQWRGGRPSDLNLAAMAAEYRAKFPAKPVICDFDSAGWAWVCAGGSIPRLPKTTDPRLLAAITRLQPWVAGSKDGRWVLREAGKQFLVYGGSGQLDLSAESGLFRVKDVNTRTGEVTPGETVQGGGKVKLPDATVVWLVKEN